MEYSIRQEEEKEQKSRLVPKWDENWNQSHSAFFKVNRYSGFVIL